MICTESIDSNRTIYTLRVVVNDNEKIRIHKNDYFKPVIGYGRLTRRIDQLVKSLTCK